jgi:hypothetical protein
MYRKLKVTFRLFTLDGLQSRSHPISYGIQDIVFMNILIIHENIIMTNKYYIYNKIGIIT